jgi:orotidine-5'-phosphate decarboxylase
LEGFYCKINNWKLKMNKNIPIENRIIFALDFDDSNKAKEFVAMLEGYTNFFKVGLQLFISEGPSLINWLSDRGNLVMLDLKLYDIPETVRLSVMEIAKKNITFTTVHAIKPVLRAASLTKGDNLKVLGVTVLTSMSQDDIQDMGINIPVSDLVLMRAKDTIDMGCDGVVASPLEVRRLREKLGEKAIIVTPGIRPSDFNERTDILSDQKRTATACQAIKDGADHLVVGRPIRDAKDPARAIMDMRDEVEKALAATKIT